LNTTAAGSELVLLPGACDCSQVVIVVINLGDMPRDELLIIGVQGPNLLMLRIG
jgi:hypothetical protein